MERGNTENDIRTKSIPCFYVKMNPVVLLNYKEPINPRPEKERKEESEYIMKSFVFRETVFPHFLNESERNKSSGK